MLNKKRNPELYLFYILNYSIDRYIDGDDPEPYQLYEYRDVFYSSDTNVTVSNLQLNKLLNSVYNDFI